MMLQFMSGNVRLLSLFVSEVSHSSSGLDQTDYYVEIERGRKVVVGTRKDRDHVGKQPPPPRRSERSG